MVPEQTYAGGANSSLYGSKGGWACALRAYDATCETCALRACLSCVASALTWGGGPCCPVPPGSGVPPAAAAATAAAVAAAPAAAWAACRATVTWGQGNQGRKACQGSGAATLAEKDKSKDAECHQQQDRYLLATESRPQR